MPRFALLALLLFAACDSGGDDDRSALRFVHASPDADLLDVFVGSSAVFETTRFGDVTRYDTLDAGEEEVRVRSSVNARAPLRFVIDFLPDARQTLVAAGVQTEMRPIVLLDSVFTGQPSTAYARIVHAAALADTVHVFFFPEASLPNVPTFPSVRFRQNTGYFDRTPGAYRLQVSTADTTAQLLDEAISLGGGETTTLVLADADSTGDLTLIRIDD